MGGSMSTTEIGRELQVADLKPRQIVVIAPPGRDDVRMTMWVEAVGAETVTFFSGAMKWHVINFIRDGGLVDDQDRPVRVFEYLGQP
jgi:hypothetical protein